MRYFKLAVTLSSVIKYSRVNVPITKPEYNFYCCSISCIKKFIFFSFSFQEVEGEEEEEGDEDEG